MKKEREIDEKRLTNLVKTKESVDRLVDMEASLKGLCARIVPDLVTALIRIKKMPTPTWI